MRAPVQRDLRSCACRARSTHVRLGYVVAPLRCRSSMRRRCGAAPVCSGVLRCAPVCSGVLRCVAAPVCVAVAVPLQYAPVRCRSGVLRCAPLRCRSSMRRRCGAAPVCSGTLPLRCAPVCSGTLPLRCAPVRCRSGVLRCAPVCSGVLRYVAAPVCSGVLRCAPVRCRSSMRSRCRSSMRSNRPRVALPNYARSMCVSIVYLSQGARMRTTQGKSRTMYRARDG